MQACKAVVQQTMPDVKIYMKRVQAMVCLVNDVLGRRVRRTYISQAVGPELRKSTMMFR